MQKYKANVFSDKFRLLNSQENVEDIKWSASDSSDAENISLHSKSSNANNKVHRKRKRRKTGHKNISNLSVKILDTSKDHRELKSVQKSPILLTKYCKQFREKSPTFAPTSSYSRSHKCFKLQPNSPVLKANTSLLSSKHKFKEKSPILLLKHTSPKISPKVKKKLFKVHQDETNLTEDSIDPIVDRTKNEDKYVLDKSKSEQFLVTSSSCQMLSKTNQHLHLKKCDESLTNSKKVCCQSSLLSSCKENNGQRINIQIPESPKEKSSTSQKSMEDTFRKISNTELINRAKTYFENHFSSGNASQSQHSISDCPTQKHNSKSSDDIEIISLMTQVNSNAGSFQAEQELVSKNPSPVSSQSAECTEKIKKIRYKKDGLASRLSSLIKKQNANVLLWQHERFLADNSNFLIPKGEHSVFLVQKVCVKYGNFLLEGIDVNDCNVLILIYSIYVQDTNISENMVLKLYEPYSIVNYTEDCKLIVNVCKYECVPFKE